MESKNIICTVPDSRKAQAVKECFYFLMKLLLNYLRKNKSKKISNYRGG